MTDAATPQIEYAIAVHGGAGGAPKEEQFRANRERILGEALDLGVKILEEGGSSLDAVEAVVRVLEDSQDFNAGKGAVYNAAGKHELDASIMDGRTRACGGVGGVTTVKNPVTLARRVMTETPHVLLVADGAEAFADEFKDDPHITRVPNSYFSTQRRRAQREEIEESGKKADDDSAMGTVGCVALDREGNLAAATSTGGLTNKKFGRIGDSPIVGAGTFADNATCAVSCTGVGEQFIRNAVAYDVSARMAYLGETLDTSVRTILSNETHEVTGGIIAVDREGNISMRFNTEGMARAAADSTGRREVHVAE